MNEATNDNSSESCTTCSTSGFNYCLFSKSLVALPALTLAAYIPTTVITMPSLQIAASVTAVALVVYGAVWLDRVPFLQRKFSPMVCSKE